MLSSKLMTMKFMANASSKEADAPKNQTNQDRDSHWCLEFEGPSKTQPTELQIVPSYTSFAGFEQGRRNFKKARARSVSPEDTGRVKHDENADETPEDEFARRQAEKRADTSNLRALQGLSSLSGQSSRTKRPTAGSNFKQAPKSKKMKK